MTALESGVDLTWIEEPMRRWDTAELTAERPGVPAADRSAAEVTA